MKEALGNLQKHISHLNKARVLIIGDLMLDKFIQGSVERISPEAPVPIINVTNEQFFLGGAANAARNVAAYGGDVCIVGVVGKDEDSTLFQSLLVESQIRSRLLVSKERPTIRKVRIISQGQQLIRFDYEEQSPLSDTEYLDLKNIISEASKDYDIIVVSDYAKGLINQDVFDHITSIGKRVIVDPKPRPSIKYKNAYLVTPNTRETEIMIDNKISSSSYEEVAKKISQITSGNVLLTLSENGMFLYSNDSALHLESKSAKVYDVTGAGDTVISTVAAALSVGASLSEAAEIANYAAAIVVSKPGTAVASQNEIIELIKELELRNINVSTN